MEASCRKAFASTCFSFAILSACCCLATSANSTHPLRFWIDEYAFSVGETTILREEIEEAGSSVAVLVGETRSSFLSVKGYYAPEQWDIYWTGRMGCVQALPHAVPGHKISCVPGLHELTMKDRLVARLTQFYGEGAFNIIPRSYLLPTQYWLWRLWLADQAPKARGEMWVLKEEKHRGKGVHVMTLKEAMQKGRERNFEGNYDLAQAYIGNQMTVVGRKFYIRLWAVVTSSFPLRAYLYDGGVVVFGNAAPEDKKAMTSDDFIVNLWHLGRTTEAAPWSVAEFRTYLDNLTGSKTAFDQLWSGMRRSLGFTFAAGVQAMRYSAAAFPVAAASATFELVGIDFLVDENMKPWLLEVNAVPSLARKVLNCDKQPGGCREDGESESVFDVEKEKLVHSLFRLLQATAGTGLTENSTSATNPEGFPSLAELLQRWRSNATDLAALNKTNASHALLDLGWHPSGEKTDRPKPASGRSLENSGRELKSAEDSSESDARGRAEAAEIVASSPPVPTVVDSAPPPLASAEDTEAVPGNADGEDGKAPAPPHIHHVARSQSVAEASNLNKYVPVEARTIRGKAPGVDASHEQILEEHLLSSSIKEIEVAVQNRFLPLMMIPEAAAYSAAYQTRGSIFPQQLHKSDQKLPEESGGLWRLVLLPFRPIIMAYGGLGRMLEHLRASVVAFAPEINFEVTMGISSVFPGTDWIFLKGYQLFGWGDRKGTIEALSVLPQHTLDQKLADHVSKILPP